MKSTWLSNANTFALIYTLMIQFNFINFQNSLDIINLNYRFFPVLSLIIFAFISLNNNFNLFSSSFILIRSDDAPELVENPELEENNEENNESE